MEGLEHLTYLGVDLIILLPFIFKLGDSRLGFGRRRRSISISTAIALAVFAIWDVFAVRAEVWAFNPAYIIGVKLAGLPVEEILFFISVPLTSILVWEATGYWKGRD